MSLLTGIYDDVNANNLPVNAVAVGGYADGAYRWSDAGWARFPTKLRTLYTVFGAPGKPGYVNAIDCEPGNPEPPAAVAWAKRELQAGRLPTIYIMSAWWSWGLAEAEKAGIAGQIMWMVAHYDNVAIPPSGAIAKQYASYPNFDLSVADPAWFNQLRPADQAVTPAPAGVVSPHQRHLAGHICGISNLHDGYWLVGSDGGVYAMNHPFEGSEGGKLLTKPVVGIEAHNDTGGYWLAAADGGVFAFGDAPFYGSASAFNLRAPIMAIATTPSGGGYWLAGGDGGVFAYGDAGFHGDVSTVRLASSIVDIIARPQGDGYWLVGGDGGVFPKGAAGYHGSEGGHYLARPVVGGAASSTGDGYWLFGADGGVFAFGDAPYLGSFASEVAADGGYPVVGGSAARDGHGYAVTTANGAVYAAGDAMFAGSL